MKSKKFDWESIDWRRVQLRIWRIQTKIYDCSKKGNEFDVVKFQKLLLSLLYNTEMDIRSNRELSLIIGLRFLLKFKKISIS